MQLWGLNIITLTSQNISTTKPKTTKTESNQYITIKIYYLQEMYRYTSEVSPENAPDAIMVIEL